jgi:hypothetical protein
MKLWRRILAALARDPQPGKDFYEDDEQLADVERAYAEGEPVVTHRPFSELRNVIEADPSRAARLDEQRAQVNERYYSAVPPSPYILALDISDLRFKLQAHWAQNMRIEQILAEALGFEKSDGGPDDPNGGNYVLGEWDAETLAMEAASRLDSFKNKDPDYAHFLDLLSKSSIGGPDALRIRAQTPHHVVEEILRRISERRRRDDNRPIENL